MLAMTQLVGFGAGNSDPYFASVRLLLHCDGADASTTFSDASTDARTVTVLDAAQVDTAQSVFGGASALFDGSGDYLSIADSASLRPGSGDFTYECFFRSSAGSHFQTLFAKGYVAAGDLAIQTDNGATPKLIVYVSGVAVITAASTYSLNAWHFFQLVRSGTTVTLYQDGVSVGSATVATNLNTTTALTIGGSPGGGGVNSMIGWVEEFRFTNGIARPNEVPAEPFPNN